VVGPPTRLGAHREPLDIRRVERRKQSRIWLLPCGQTIRRTGRGLKHSPEARTPLGRWILTNTAEARQR
jgi:hypothetical protein